MIIGPIFRRELRTSPRRARQHVLRACYVGLLFVLAWTTWQAIIGFQRVHRQGDFSHFNRILFEVLSFTQLCLTLFAASMVGATAVSSEKDRRTFVLLLVTRLTDAEIVTNKFLGAMLQIGSALLSAAPAFLLTMLLGGVAPAQVGSAFLVTTASAIVGAAVGVLVGVWRESTFQAVALTLLFIGASLVGVELACYLGEGWGVDRWAAWLSPFRAMTEVVSAAPVLDDAQRFPASVAFAIASLALAASALTLASVRLRAWNPRGEPIQQPEEESTTPAPAPGAGRSRPVWNNPLLWREIRTRAYGTRPILIKFGYLTIVAILLLSAATANVDGDAGWIAARSVIPAAILSLLLINAQAVAAIAMERDLKALDLLLVTDVTPREFIFGKLGGIGFNTLEMILAPLLMLAACAWWGLIGPLSAIYAAGGFLTFVVFAAVLGVHAALRYESSRGALANSLGTMFLLCVGILICLFLILISGRFEAQWASFLAFIVFGSIGLWVSLSANAPSNAIAVTAAIAPFATFYCVIAILIGDRAMPFLVGTSVYGFAVASLLIPLVSEFDVATGRTSDEH